MSAEHAGIGANVTKTIHAEDLSKIFDLMEAGVDLNEEAEDVLKADFAHDSGRVAVKGAAKLDSSVSFWLPRDQYTFSHQERV